MKKEHLTKLLTLLLIVAMVIGVTACGGGESGKSGKSGKTDMSVCLASEPETLDPALNSSLDGATMLCHLFSGLGRWEEVDGKMVVVPDCATELPKAVINADGTATYTYTLKDGLKWSDGKDLTAKDFAYAWQRAAAPATASDYGYIFQIIDGYNSLYPPDGSPAEPDAKLNVVAKDDKTLVVTLTTDVPYWNEMLAFPTYFPVREDVVSDKKWATEAATYVGNGAFKMKEWTHKSVITLEKNENYHDADAIKLKTLNFFLSDDANNMLSNFKTGDWQLIDDIPSEELENIKKDDKWKDSYNLKPQIGTYYTCWNINKSLLPEGSNLTGVEAEKAQQEIRIALNKLFDRNYIVKEVAKGGQLPASSFVAYGTTDEDGKTNFCEKAGSSDKFHGYFDPSEEAVSSNYDEAVQTLKKYYNYDEATKTFTNIPEIPYLYNTSEGHKAIGEYLQAQFAGVGITMNMENQEWNTFLATRKAGNYFYARNGWVSDYNDPICFLDLWTTNSGNNDIQFGRDAHEGLAMYSVDLTDIGDDMKVENGTWAETYDVLIGKIKTATDPAKRYKMMHKAEDLLMSTGCVCPIYYYTDSYMLDPSVKGLVVNPLGTKYFLHCYYE